MSCILMMAETPSVSPHLPVCLYIACTSCGFNELVCIKVYVYYGVLVCLYCMYVNFDMQCLSRDIFQSQTVCDIAKH